jgi:O-antigen/teichoic acid export membrane protein
MADRLRRWGRRVTSPAGAQAMALVDQALVSGNTFATTVLIARLAGLEALGTYTLVWMVVLLVNAIQAALVIAPMVSLAPANPRRMGYLGHFLRAEWKLLTHLGAIAVAVGTTGIVTVGAPSFLVVASIAAILGYQVFDFARRLAYVCGRSAVAALGSSGAALLQLGLLFAVGATGELDAAVALMIAATAMTSAAVCMGGGVLPAGGIGPPDPGLAARSWYSSRWLLGSALMQWICGNLFLLLAPAFVGLTALGALRAAQSIVGITNVWQHGLENIVPLRTGQVWRDEGPRQAVRYAARVTAAWAGITAIIAVPIALGAKTLLSTIHGADTADYDWVLQAYVFLQVLMLFGLPLRSLLRAAEQTRGIFAGFTVAALCSVVSVVPLLRSYGLAGALVGLGGAQVAFQGVLLIYIWKGLSTFGRRSAVRFNTT